MNKRLRVLVAGLTVILGVLLVTGCSGSNNETVFGTAASGGTYSRFGKAFTKYIKDNSDITVRTRKTAGSASNVRLLNGGYIQMAIVQSDILDEAYNGTGSFAGKKYKNLRAASALYTEQCQIITRKDSGIKTISDLEDKNVSVGEEDSGTEHNAQQILAAYGLSSSDLNEKHLSYEKAAKQLKSGKIDALFVTAGAPTEMIENLAKDIEVSIVPVSGDPARRLIKNHRFYTKTVIKAGTYEGVDKDVETIGVSATLVTSSDVDEKKVRKITKLYFADKDDLAKEIKIDLLDEKNAVKNVTIPFHKGAAKYYSSKGIMVKSK